MKKINRYLTFGIALVLTGIPSIVRAEQDSMMLVQSWVTDSFEQGLEVLKGESLEPEDYRRAIANFNVVIQQRPFEPGPYINRGIALQKLGDYDRALQDFEKAIEVDPENGLAYLNIGMLYYELNNYQDANAYFNSAIKLLKQELDKLTAASQLTGSSKPPDIDQIRAKIPVIQSNLASAYNFRSITRRMQGNLPGAIEDCNQAIQLDSSYAHAFLNRGILWFRQQQYDLALDDLNQAVSLNPRLAEAYNNMGVIWLSQNQPENALSNFNLAIEIEPNNPDLIYNRALALVNPAMETKDMNAAREDFRRAANLYRQQNNNAAAEKAENYLRQFQR